MHAAHAITSCSNTLIGKNQKLTPTRTVKKAKFRACEILYLPERILYQLVVSLDTSVA